MEFLSEINFISEQPTVLDAINVAKVGTGVVIFLLGGQFGFSPRATIYTGLHMSYLSWWLIEQALFPPFASGRFQLDANLTIFGVAFLVIGVFYALPAFNSFLRPPSPTPSAFVAIASIMMFSLGSLINTMADVQMHTAKTIQKGLVTDGIFALSQNPNYFGDWLRYGSFCLISGRPSSFLLLALIATLNLSALQDPTTKGKMATKYGSEYAEWTETHTTSKVVPMLDANALSIMGAVLAVWAVSYGLGRLFRTKKLATGHASMTTNGAKKVN